MPLEQSALLIGNLTHAGIDVQPVLNGIRTWMGKVSLEEDKANAALDGTAKGAQKASDILSKVPTNFTDLYNTIKNATSSQAAYNDAVEAFGSRSAPVMVKAIRDGTLNLTDFQALVNSNTTDINTMAANTITLSQAFQLFKQQTELAFAPLGNTIATSLKGALSSLTPLTGLMQGIGQAFDALPTPVKNVIVLFGALMAAVGPTVLSFGGHDLCRRSVFEYYRRCYRGVRAPRLGTRYYPTRARSPRDPDSGTRNVGRPTRGRIRRRLSDLKDATTGNR